MALVVKIECGFVEVEAGLWLMGCGQPAAFFGAAVRRRRKGWLVRDRSRLDLVETTAAAKCADSSRPFLTHIPCAAPVFAVSGKVLVAPASARKGSHLVKAIPMSVRNSLCVTEFGLDVESPATSKPQDHEMSSWVVMATRGRTTRIRLAEDETVSARPEAVVAWTGKMPTGFCQKLSIWDVLLPRGTRNLLLTFYGPGIVWIEGSQNLQALKPSNFYRRVYGI